VRPCFAAWYCPSWSTISNAVLRYWEISDKTPSEDSLCRGRLFVPDFFRLHQAARCHRLLIRNVVFHPNVHMVSKANKPTLRLLSLFSSSGKWYDNYPLVCFLLGNSPASEFCMPQFRNTVCSIFILHTYTPMKMEQGVPKRWHIKFRRLGVTQKKAYNI